MNVDSNDIDVYGLTTELCEHTLKKYNSTEDHPYSPKKDNTRIIQKLRAKAYEILLNKSPKLHNTQVGRRSKTDDPIVELLKHIFVLKIGQKSTSQAADLENLLDELIDDKLDVDPVVYSTLQLLIELKNFKPECEPPLNVFHYGKTNPLLPEVQCNGRDIPPFQIYPMESFILPEKFEALLGIKRSCIMQDCIVKPSSRFSFLSQFKSTATIEIESLRSQNESITPSMISNSSKGMVKFIAPREFSTVSYILPRVIEDLDDTMENYYLNKERILVKPELPWTRMATLHTNTEIISEVWDLQTSDHCLYDESENIKDYLTLSWEDIYNDPPVSNYRTWETLGKLEPPMQPQFISETIETISHLRKIRQANILPLLPKKVIDSVPLITEISDKEFMSNIKLLLLGIESSSFVYDNVLGFKLQKNITIPGISVEALEDICCEVIQWGTCFRALSILITPNSQTGKMQKDGLIFKAMCNSIKELLLHYQATILRIPVNDNDSMGLLKLLKLVSPMGLLIVEVARLCRCDTQTQIPLDEGLGILTHIYEEVTKVTKPNVALVFYSILKSCCEVYFRLLQKWLFEGVCDDVYGEFMIKVRPQYLRHRDHKFWTKCFGINAKSVPGFLEDLTESILQCGKAVRLLKLCDPKNPLCAVFVTSHPAVRVCLSVGQLREQLMHCQEYMSRGQTALGSVVSLSSAFQEQRNIERQRAELMTNAHQDTLSRIKREREEFMKELARNKRKLLEKLKDQAEEAALRKEKDKEAQLLADKLFTEKINKEQEEIERIQHVEKANILHYYNELAAEAERRRVRADWRIRRMQLFDERIALISSVKHELLELKNRRLVSTTASECLAAQTEQNDEKEKDTIEKSEKVVVDEMSKSLNFNEPVRFIDLNVTPEDLNLNTCEDENSNPAEDETSANNATSLLDKIHVNTNSIELGTDTVNTVVLHTDNSNENENNIRSIDENFSVKSSRPTVLNVTPISLSTKEIGLEQNLVSRQAMRQNKAKVMGQFAYTNHDCRKEEKGNDKNNAQNLFCYRETTRSEALANQLKNTDSSIQFSNITNITDVMGVNNEMLVKKLEILRYGKMDNMTEAERNKLKVLQQEYGITPNNNETNIILSELGNSESNDRINQIDNFIDNPGQNKFVKVSINQNVRIQDHIGRVDQLLEASRNVTNFNLTDAQKNRNKNIAHHINEVEELQSVHRNVDESSLTDAQKNKIKNMERSTNYGTYITRNEFDKVRPTKLTEAQNNQARIMEQEIHIFGSTVDKRSNDMDNYAGTPTVIPLSSSTSQIAVDVITPMSCTTDHFPLSMSSSLSQLHNYADSPLSETDSEVRFTTTTGEILTGDTTKSNVTEVGFKFSERTPMFPNFLGFGSAAMTPTSESSLTVADVEMIDNTSLKVYLEKSVTIPLYVQSRLVNDAIIKYMLHEHNMLLHFRSLRSYFFLLNGEFSRNLTNSLYTRLYEISIPAQLLNSATLANVLEKALISSLSCNHANSERLSFSAIDVPSQLQVSNPEALDCLCLNYKVSWPLNIILDETLMLQYKKVFKFLLMVGRVIWVLQEDFHILKVERKAAHSEQYHKLQLYRHSMMQFSNALHNYLTCSVLHASWTEFEKDLENAITLDQVYFTHVNYIKKILSRCMLSMRGEKIRNCLRNVFKVILKFHNRIRSQNWVPGPIGYTHPNYKKLEQMYQAFCELRTYLAHVATKLANSGYQPHLMHFLNALNINHLYDLTIKK